MMDARAPEMRPKAMKVLRAFSNGAGPGGADDLPIIEDRTGDFG
jgi:hypothetical protein